MMHFLLGNIILKEKGRVRESIPRQVDKKSRLTEEEIGVWNSQGGGKDKCLFFFFFFFFFLSTVLHFSHLKGFSLNQELMIIKQTTQFKLCTKDYITTMYPA